LGQDGQELFQEVGDHFLAVFLAFGDHESQLQLIEAGAGQIREFSIVPGAVQVSPVDQACHTSSVCGLNSSFELSLRDQNVWVLPSGVC
jgi:hypothetical protein